MDVEKFIAAGERMGLTGADLRAYADKKEGECHDREERAQRREDERRLKEGTMVAEKAKQVEEDHRRRIWLAEQDDVRREKIAELEKEKAMREHERQILQLQIEETKKAGGHADSGIKAMRPKLPSFDETRDDMDAFLERFERFVSSNGWPTEAWAVSLSPLLTGKGLQVYSSMPSDEADDYDGLKKALLKRYQLTEEGFRRKFREDDPEKGETLFQYTSRIKRYFTRWVDMSECDKSYEGLEDLLVREQIISKCSKDMSLFLRERAPSDVSDMITLGEQYLEAHGGTISRSKTSRTDGGQYSRNVKPMTSSRWVSSKEKTCFLCNKVGHIARDCLHRDQQRRVPRPAAGMQDQGDPNGARSYEGDRGRSPTSRKSRYRGGYHSRTQKEKNKDKAYKSDRDQTDVKRAAACQEVSKERPVVYDCIEDGFLKLANGREVPVISGACDGHRELPKDHVMPVREGLIGSSKVQVLRDTGCSSAAVRESIVSPEQMLGREHLCILIDGTVRRFRMAKIEVDTPFYTGEMEVMCMRQPIYDLILGNVTGVSDMPDEMWGNKEDTGQASAVTTRAQAQKEKIPIKPLVVAPTPEETINVEELKKAQREDTSLQKLWEMAENGEPSSTRGNHQYRFEVEDGVLYRIYTKPRGGAVEDIKQIVTPTKYRQHIMRLAHESIVGGHLGIHKTVDRITSSFHWIGVVSDVTRFCRSCDACQRTIPKGRVTRVPLGEMPIIDEPFQRIAVDLIGPIYPVSEKGNRYILTIVDYGTRYPEAVPLKRIETENVAEALLATFCRVGFPKEVLSDRGPQFVSHLMAEVCRLVSVKQIFTTPYNRRCNGLCERVNCVLKAMLKKMCEERPKDWDRYLPAVLFAYREVPQASTGFAPFELLYGRSVRGPMQVLKELMTGRDTPETMNTYQYVLNLRNRLEETCKLVRENLQSAQDTYKHHYDKGTRKRSFVAGQKVLLLLPTDANKLLLHWKGPYEVTEVINRMDYKMRVGNKVKIYHINLLKRYFERDTKETVSDTDDTDREQAGVAIIEDEVVEEVGVVADEELLELGYVQRKDSETYKDVQINDGLSWRQKKEVKSLVREFAHIFTEKPGTTHLAEHRIETTSKEPVKVKPYPIPYAKREAIEEEIKAMLESGVIEPANSPYNAPIVLVKKKDGTNRFCIDFRRINRITKFDTEPMGNVDDILVQLDKDTFFTKIDLSKGYWQIPVAEECRPMTAFTSPNGSYQFRKMPFGLVNSAATFNRMMRTLLGDLQHTDHYVDDVLEHTVTWSDHMKELREIFQKIRDAGLTIRPTKCLIGYKTLGFVGHIIGDGEVRMEKDKVDKIKNAPRPQTKSQVRSFLGLAGYYRKFVPGFAEVAVPLTDLTRKGSPNKVSWSEPQERSFQTLKDLLTREPILRMASTERTFVLQTDASSDGVGAVLLQEYEDGKFPVAYASKKLLDREKRYSVIERECLALVFGVRKFQCYLYGKEFVLQTDHMPLSYLNKCRLENGRLMRWALYMQSYRFRLEAIKGKENVGADYLSRM